MNNQEIFQILISVGRSLESGSEPSEYLVNSLNLYSRVNLLPHDMIKTEIDSFTNTELISLLKGLTYVEKKLKWAGGSVAVSKPIYDVLCARDSDVERVRALVDWITVNTGNFFNQIRWIHESYLRGHYSSDAEYQIAIKKKEEARARTQRIKDEAREKTEKEAEDQRGIRKTRKFAGHRDRCTPIRAEIISKLNNLQIQDQLIMIAEQDVYAPTFFPTKCASSARIDEIESLPDKIKEQLALKLKGKQRGPWRGFKKRLLSVYEPTNDHR